MARAMPGGWFERSTGLTVEMVAPGCDWVVLADDYGEACVQAVEPVDDEGDPCWLTGEEPTGYLAPYTSH